MMGQIALSGGKRTFGREGKNIRKINKINNNSENFIGAEPPGCGPG